MWRVIRTVFLLFTGAVLGVLGAAGLLRGWFGRRAGAADPSSDEIEIVAIFDGAELTSQASAFRGGRVLAWFGGIDVDLRGATIVDGAELDVRALFGGIAVHVPAGVRVDGHGRAILGGVDLSSGGPDDPGTPTIIVRAAAAFGGISVGR